MEFILLLGMGLVIVMLNNSKNSINEKFESLQSNFDTLFSDLRRLESKIRELEKPISHLQEEPVITIIASEPLNEEIQPVNELDDQVVEQLNPAFPDIIPVKETVHELPEIIRPFQPEEEQPEELSFWERYPDLEKFIGENLVNKIGIAILVLGMGFFLKYAIDQNWINEIGRTCIGLVTGGILIALAHKMRNAYPAFGSVLIGGGLAILYFSVTIAYHQYHLIGQSAAFVTMIIITAATVFLSVVYERIELAVFAILGGFGAPFLVSSGEGNYIVLFTYLLILNAGMLVLAYYKKWNLLNQISFVFTVAIYGGWLYTKVLDPSITIPKPYVGALIFATFFYFIFFLMNIINNVKETVKFNVLEIGQILSNTALYFSAGMLILGAVNDGLFKGTFTICLALFNFIFAFLCYKNDKVDRNLLYLLIGLVLTFVSLAAPIQLNGNYITLFWTLESILLVWLAYKSGLAFLRDVSVLLIGLLIISLAMDWHNIYILTSSKKDILYPVFNKGFITSFFSIAGITGYTYLINRYFRSEQVVRFKVADYIYCLKIGIFLLSYAGILFEFNHQVQTHFPVIKPILLGCYNYIWANALLSRSNRMVMEMKVVILVYAISLICLYPLYFNNEVIEIRNNYLQESSSSFSDFLIHYLLFALLILTLSRAYTTISSLIDTAKMKEVTQVAIITLLVYVASAELDHLAVFNRFSASNPIDSIIRSTHKAGYAILWGICSFILIYLGMKWKSQTVRIASLALFGITLLKLFLFDIRGLSEGGKIAAFISLGLMLLVVSFMYQKLKKLILVDEMKVESEKDISNPD